VQSSDSLKVYNIDLVTKVCNCSDFPRIRLCKHLAAVDHFFGGADLGPQPPDNTSDDKSPAQQDGNANGSTNGGTDDATASIISAANEIARLSQELLTKAPSNPRMVKSLNLMRSQLNAFMLMTTEGSRLPEKENIAPNQHTWLEMAVQMGEKRGKKHHAGKVDSTQMAQHIGEHNRK